MINKILRGCFVALISCGLFISVQGAEMVPKMNGSIDAYATTGSAGMNVASKGDVIFSVNTQAGGWDITAVQELDIAPNIDASADVILYEQKVTLEDETMAICAGKFTPYGITMGGAYVKGAIDDFIKIGQAAPANIANNLAFTLKDLGLTAAISFSGNDTVFGAIYSTSFGDFDIAGEFVSGTISGTAASVIALAGAYKITESMSVALNIEAATPSKTILWFDMGFGNSSGISVGYGIAGSSTDMELTYSTVMDSLTLYATYFSDAGVTSLGGGAKLSF